MELPEGPGQINGWGIRTGKSKKTCYTNLLKGAKRSKGTTQHGPLQKKKAGPESWLL